MASYLKREEKKQYDEWKRLSEKGLLLTPKGIRFICEANNCDPALIGKHILDLLPKIEADERQY